jgi:hypothetical protein
MHKKIVFITTEITEIHEISAKFHQNQEPDMYSPQLMG